MNKIYLGIGTNVGNKEKNILNAIDLLSHKLSNVHSASFYFSSPVGYTKQDDFLNTALVAETNLSPEDLFILIKEVEKKVGRIKRFRWGPREIDIDILFYNNYKLKTENLEIPHPRLHERDFVLVPLMDLDQTIVHPVYNKTIKELFEAMPKGRQSIKEKASNLKENIR